MLQSLVDQAPERIFRHGYHCQQLQADVQCSAASFYLINGWHFLFRQPPQDAPLANLTSSDNTNTLPDVHWDAGIPHVPMALELKHHQQQAQQQLHLGFDSSRYHWPANDGISVIALLQLLICQNPLAMMLTIPDLRHPVWSHQTTLQTLSNYLRGSSRREVQVLIQSEYKGIQEHPLIQLTQRIGRLNVRCSHEAITHQLLAWPYGYLNWTAQSGEVCFNNRRECSQRKRNFEHIRDNSSSLKEGRRIHL